MALRRDPPPRRTGPELYRRQLGRLRLNIGDVEDVMVLLRARTKNVVLRAGRAVADEAADLKEATPTELSDVTIVSENPPITARLGRHAAEVNTAAASDDAAKALVDDVFGLLNERRNFWAGSSPMWLFFGTGLVGGLLIFGGAILNHKGRNSSPLWPLLMMIAIGVIFGAVSWRDYVKNGIAIIEPAKLSERRLRLNGLWLNVLIAGSSAIIAAVLTYWQVTAK